MIGISTPKMILQGKLFPTKNTQKMVDTQERGAPKMICALEGNLLPPRKDVMTKNVLVVIR